MAVMSVRNASRSACRDDSFADSTALSRCSTLSVSARVSFSIAALHATTSAARDSTAEACKCHVAFVQTTDESDSPAGCGFCAACGRSRLTWWDKSSRLPRSEAATEDRAATRVWYAWAIAAPPRIVFGGASGARAPSTVADAMARSNSSRLRYPFPPSSNLFGKKERIVAYEHSVEPRLSVVSPAAALTAQKARPRRWSQSLENLG